MRVGLCYYPEMPNIIL